jgi:secretion/DNA translocation related TadE-like protein
VLVALWAAVLALLAAAAIVLASVLAARAAVAAAADLGALAGASAGLEDPATACTRARDVVAANGAVLESCRSSGVDVWVVAVRPAPDSVRWLLHGRSGLLAARAHAELVPAGT